MTKPQIWQGGVCKGLVVDSPEARARLEAIYGPLCPPLDLYSPVRLEAEPIGLTPDEQLEQDENTYDFLEWLMITR